VPVHAVSAWTFPVLAAMTTIPSLPAEDFREMAQVALDDAVAAEVPADVSVTRRVVQGKPAVVLAAEANADDILVVGRRGMGGFERLLLGSVSRGVLRRTHVPTVIVPAAPCDGSGVIVGIDDRGSNPTVLAAAADAARRRHTRCLALCAVETGLAGVGLGGAEAVNALIDAARMITADAAAEMTKLDVEAEGEAIVGPAGGVLVDASERAELLVLGRRFHGILGSVVDICAAHAACPVLVVPEP
jgi:nucleotide-binding universal stress UspA family protein